MALPIPIHSGRRLPSSLPTSLPRLPIFFFASLAGPPALRRAGFRAKRARGGGAMPLCVNLEAAKTEEPFEGAADEWGKVSAVLFDMDGVLCDSEHLSRLAAVNVFAEMGVSVTTDDFVPFMGTGESNFLRGVASLKGIKDFDPQAAKKRFFEIYLDKYAKPNSGIGFPGAFELVSQCKEIGLKIAVASSADRIKVNANLNAAGLPVSTFDAIISADAFENLKPAPDIFLAASKYLNVPVNECVVIEDAVAGIQAAKAAKMRCIAVKTTLSEEDLLQECPSLIRNDIGDIVLEDIINGGHPSSDKKVQEHSNASPRTEYFSEQLIEEANENSRQDVDSNITLRVQISRRDIVRYGSLGISFSCLLFAATNWKAMRYASPNGVLNMLLGSTNSIFDLSVGGLQSTRVQQFVSYINDIETRGTARSVPDFQSKLDWLNSAPLSWGRDLKGKIVLLDFWTYCCINCMHVLPDLEFLEKKYINKPFTVIGVHSAKFDNEKDLEAIRNAVLRYNISHPVVNDGEMYLWRALGINSWPTFALVGPSGKLIAQISGEGHKEDLDDLVEAALLYYGEKKALKSTPLPLALEKDNDPRLSTSPLRFPGKLAIDDLNNRLFISDSNHNRIVVTDLDGNYILQVGSSGQGLNDGTFDSATFNRPQGLAYNPKKNLLYVADTENHALREIDFVTEMVRTLAGNGTKGSDYTGGGKGMDQVLNSPWDVCFDSVNELVYIAMAGQHQIWLHNVKDGITRVFSGDGFERNLNGSSSSSTSFAQPSGISIFPGSQEAYIADSESSSIRSLDLKTGGSRLIAGGDPMFAENLFRFGDHDGTGTDALLQHPLGILCAKNKAIYVADSYNHKIKKLDRMNRKVITVAGAGKAGFKDGRALAAQLSEPSGIVEDGSGKFFIADTNNNLIRVLELKGGDYLLSTLELKGVQPPSPKKRSMRRLRRKLSSDTEIIKVGSVLSRQGNLNLRITVPEGYHLSKEAKSKFEVEVEPANGVVIEPLDGFLSPEGSASLEFERSSSSAASGRINCKVYYCKEDEVCLYQSLAFEVPFEEVIGDSTSNAEANLQYTVKPRVGGASL